MKSEPAVLIAGACWCVPTRISAGGVRIPTLSTDG
jgi:hypothetical protein